MSPSLCFIEGKFFVIAVDVSCVPFHSLRNGQKHWVNQLSWIGFEVFCSTHDKVRFKIFSSIKLPGLSADLSCIKMDTFSLDLQLVFFRNNGILNWNLAEKNICKKDDYLSSGWWPNGAKSANEKHYILSKNVQNYNEQSNAIFVHKLLINKIIF